MQPIGGFIGLEFKGGTGSYHPDALSLVSGRSCFNYFLLENSPSRVYVPFYTCDALLEPLIANKISFDFYAINENLEPVFNKKLIHGKEYLVYINYFDIKNKTTLELEKKYNDALIIDNTQGFFNRKYTMASASFNSCRKFFGVPDGGYLYLKKNIKRDFTKNNQYLYEHLISRAIDKEDVYYQQFKENEKIVGTCEIKGMSTLSEKILTHTDYALCRQKRIQNFQFLHEHLSDHNQLNIDMESVGTPHYYPFLPARFIDKKKLISQKLFIPILWRSLLARDIEGFNWEKQFTENLLPLPIDQQYEMKDMAIVIEKLMTFL